MHPRRGGLPPSPPAVHDEPNEEMNPASWLSSFVAPGTAASFAKARREALAAIGGGGNSGTGTSADDLRQPQNAAERLRVLQQQAASDHFGASPAVEVAVHGKIREPQNQAERIRLLRRQASPGDWGQQNQSSGGVLPPVPLAVLQQAERMNVLRQQAASLARAPPPVGANFARPRNSGDRLLAIKQQQSQSSEPATGRFRVAEGNMPVPTAGGSASATSRHSRAISPGTATAAASSNDSTALAGGSHAQYPTTNSSLSQLYSSMETTRIEPNTVPSMGPSSRLGLGSPQHGHTTASWQRLVGPESTALSRQSSSSSTSYKKMKIDNSTHLSRQSLGVMEQGPKKEKGNGNASECSSPCSETPKLYDDDEQQDKGNGSSQEGFAKSKAPMSKQKAKGASMVTISVQVPRAVGAMLGKRRCMEWMSLLASRPEDQDARSMREWLVHLLQVSDLDKPLDPARNNVSLPPDLLQQMQTSRQKQRQQQQPLPQQQHELQRQQQWLWQQPEGQKHLQKEQRQQRQQQRPSQHELDKQLASKGYDVQLLQQRRPSAQHPQISEGEEAYEMKGEESRKRLHEESSYVGEEDTGQRTKNTAKRSENERKREHENKNGLPSNYESMNHAIDMSMSDYVRACIRDHEHLTGASGDEEPPTHLNPNARRE